MRGNAPSSILESWPSTRRSAHDTAAKRLVMCCHFQVDMAPALEALQLPNRVVEEEGLRVECAQQLCPFAYERGRNEVATLAGRITCHLYQLLDAELLDVDLLSLERTVQLIAVKKPLHE